MRQGGGVVCFPSEAQTGESGVLPPSEQADVSHGQQGSLLLGLAADTGDGLLSDGGHAGALGQLFDIRRGDQRQDHGDQLEAGAVGPGVNGDGIPDDLPGAQMIFSGQLFFNQFDQFLG